VITFNQAAELAFLVSLSFLASGAGVFVFGPHRWSALVRPVVVSLVLAVVIPVIAVSVFDMHWNTRVLALAVVVIGFTAAFNRPQPSTSPNDDWP
jgi:xanthine/uracil permease